jgi:hypothetical protein
VAIKLWGLTSQDAGVAIGDNFDNIGAKRLSNKKFLVINMIDFVGLWAMWKMRNNMCF